VDCTQNYSARAFQTRTFQGGDCKSQQIPRSQPTQLNFSSEQFDTASMHTPNTSCTTTNSRYLVAPVTGIYEISAGFTWGDAGLKGMRRLALQRNSNEFIAEDQFFAEANYPNGGQNNTSQNVSTTYRLNAGDSVAAVVEQRYCMRHIPPFPEGPDCTPIAGTDALTSANPDDTRNFLAMSYVGPG
jgi:hypothetical protein